jgi:hypothetical protein
MARGKLAARQGAADNKKNTGSAVKAGANNGQEKREKVSHPSV